MGCLNSKDKPPVVVDDDNVNHYSWSDKSKVNPKDYTIENGKYETFIRKPGDIVGQQFIIENCEFTNIALFDYINTITIDECNNCTIFIGPTIGSVVLRNCVSCHIMCCAQQFRSRDCKNIDIFLYCATQPAIESCYDLTFGCFSANYKGLEDQFKKANLSVLNNNWTNIYDFTLNDGEQHWSLFANSVKAEDYFSGIPNDNDIDLSFNSTASIVPKTVGPMPTTLGISGELCLAVIIAGEQTLKTAISLINDMKNESEIYLLKTKEFNAITTESQLMFDVEPNQVIVALLYKGLDCIKRSQNIGKGYSGVMFITDLMTIYKQMSVIFNTNN
ncbi:protein XRP2-like [Oppia nitens]|uniref:protein XRP2-like n=1 Tax=Oppia nitens TaxID=1686743 RepID=UPI0023DB633B|nr:protein XRP2-like [Oppia nitens]